MLLQLAFTGALTLNVAPTQPFYEHRAMLSVRWRPCPVAGWCAHVGGMLAKDNAVPFLQVINDGDSVPPTGAVLSHWALGVERAWGRWRAGPALARAQRELPPTSLDPASYYVAVALGVEYLGFGRLERTLATPKQWRLGATRTQLRLRYGLGALVVRETERTPDGVTFWTVEVGARWRMLALSYGDEPVPTVVGPLTLERNRALRVSLVFGKD